MHKFSVDYPEYNPEKPVLYKIILGKKYFIHKGKDLKASTEKFLDDVFRGMRNKGCPDAYKNVVHYCNTNTALYKVSVEIILNADPDKILRKEDQLYKNIDEEVCLNNPEVPPYRPEWMIKQSLQKRCETCITTGSINNKKTKFKFCPHCGRLNK
jgi:hypothetical protein